MGDRANINLSYGGRQSGVDGEAIMASYGGTGVTVQPIVPTPALYSDDFGYPDNTVLVGGTPNWTAISVAGVTDNAKFDPVVIGGQITIRPSGATGDANNTPFGGAGKYLLSPVDVASANQFFQFAVPVLTNAKVNVLATDERTRLRISIDSNNTAVDALTGSASNTLANFSTGATARFQGGISNGTYKDAVAGSVFTARVYAGKLYMARNNATFGAVAGLDVSTVTGTRVGISTYLGQFQQLDNLRAGALTGKLFITDQLKAYPRVKALGGFANGGATVAIAGTYLGTAPTGLQWALYDPELGTLVKDYARVSAPTIAGGNWSGSIVVPWGMNGVKPYRLAIRAENDTWNEDFGRVPFYVAVNILGVGQSNMSFMNYSTTAGINDHAGGIMYFPDIGPGQGGALNFFPPRVTSSWESSTTEGTGTDMLIGRFTEILSKKIGGPVMWSSVAIAAQEAPQLDPAAVSTNGTWIRTHLAFIGAFEAIMCAQGEGEIYVGNTTDAAAWKAQWAVTNYPGYRSYSGQPTGTVIPIFQAITGKYTDAPGTNSNADAAVIRRAQAEISIAPNAVSDSYVAAHTVGLKLEDTPASTVHLSRYDKLGYYKLAERFALSLAKIIAGGSFDGLGPRAQSPTRSGAVVTIPVSSNGADSLAQTTGGNLTGFQVATSSTFASPLSQASAVLTGSNIVITLSADPGVAVYVRNYVGFNPDDSNNVVGNYTSQTAYYTGTIEMAPISIPLLTST